MKSIHPKRSALFIAYLFFFLFFASQNIHAQFILNGSAVQISDTCWTLTTETDFDLGSMWNNEKISLNESFEIQMQLNFGDKDGDGADGILFGLQPLATSIGQAGAGMGFQGVSPSIGIEFDTYQNFNLEDPQFDHIAIIRDGSVDHTAVTNLAGPVQASSTSGNIEDGQWHTLLVTWDAATLTLEVSFDDELRLSYIGDIVNDVFDGDPEVFWGFTSATGGANNLQQVCLSCTIFRDELDDVVICPGGQFQIGNGGGNSYEWTPATGLSNPNIANPIASPNETTTYIVEITGACTYPIYDTLTVFVDGDTVFFDLGVDTTFCQGENVVLDATSTGTIGVDYQWSNGSTEPTVTPTQSGLYSVTVTIDDYCVADDRVGVTVIPSPDFIDLGPDQLLCLEQTMTLEVSFPGDAHYEWSTGATTPSIEVTTENLYSVLVSNICGSTEASVYISFEDCREVFFPNVFSPNNDGINDVFYPLDGGDVHQIKSLRIYDRWGGHIFENYFFLSSEIAEGWNGKAKGERVSPGVYVWFAEVEFIDGVTEMLEGEIMVID